MKAKTFIDPSDIECLPRQLWLHRFNHEASISEAMQLVNNYLPVPDFNTAKSDQISTTVIAAFYPISDTEVYQRHHKNGKPKKRSPDEYINGLKNMILACTYLVIFVPPGPLAEELRSLGEGKNVVIFDHYQSVWDLPHPKDKRESFYTRETQLHRSLGPRGTRTGEPHSWGAWNAKTYLWLEAIKLDPFKTTHFAWLDVRTPLTAREAFPHGHALVAGTWPHPAAIKSLYRAMKYDMRALVVLNYDHPLIPPVKNLWPTERPQTKPCSVGIDDVIGIGASLFFGDKASMSRLARAHLNLFERDFARDFYVAREELQMSYAFWEFDGLYRVLELFRRRSLELPMKIGFYAYMLLSRPDIDWSGLNLDKEPERLPRRHFRTLSSIETRFSRRWALCKGFQWEELLLKRKPRAPASTSSPQDNNHS